MKLIVSGILFKLLHGFYDRPVLWTWSRLLERTRPIAACDLRVWEN